MTTPTLTRKALADRIAVLRLARSILEENGGIPNGAGRQLGICMALVKAAYQQPRLEHADAELRRYITRALSPFRYLEGWIAAHTNTPIGHIESQPERMLATRLAWIDWMIEQYEQYEQYGQPPKEPRS